MCDRFNINIVIYINNLIVFLIFKTAFVIIISVHNYIHYFQIALIN